jgi:Tol biopolymer transport system component
MNTHPIRRAAIAAVVATASAASAMSAQAATPTGKIVFSRSQLSSTDAPRSRSLWMLDMPSGQVRALTTATDRVFDATATWAPDGSSLVFERGATGAGLGERYSLQMVSAGSGQRPHALIHGLGQFARPAWGPGNRIAFVSMNASGQCVSIVDASGRNRRDLFCATATEFARPTWSADGTRLFVAGTAPEGVLGESWHARAYRVDVATGSTKLLSDILMDFPLALTFSPDGTRGVYADIAAGDMTLVDFRNGTTTLLPRRGHSPLFSPDGRRIVFTGEVFEVTPGQTRYYEPLYIVGATGTGLRRLTDSRVADHAYTAAQWSRDNTHVLLNRRTYATADVGLTRPLFALRMVDVDTRAITQLPAGYAEPGGWYEPK